jgi:hypothetical protein
VKKSLPIQLTDYEHAKFWAKTDVRDQDECWPWKGTFAGGANAAGIHYGVMRLKATLRKHIRVNRISAFLAYGPPPTDYHFANHTCNNPNCVNPKHIYWGLPDENSKDALEDGVLYERRKGRRKITEEQVREIRKDKRSARTIGRQYGLTKLSILRIKSRRTWAFLD